MNHQDVPVPALPGTVRAGGGPLHAARRALDGITGKIAAVVAGLLVVFLLASAALVAQVLDLGSEPPQEQALEAGQATSLKSLVEYQEVLVDWNRLLVAGNDSRARAAVQPTFQANRELVERLLAEAQRELPPGTFRDEAATFARAFATLEARHDRALAAFVATGGTDAATADAAVGDLATAPFERFEDVTESMGEELEVLQEKRVEQVDTRVAVIVGTGVLLLIGLIVVTAFVVRRIVRPIRELTATAERVARHDLPDAVSRIRTLAEDEELPAVEPIALGTRDETASLASAIDTLRSSAVSLAIEQRRAERESAEMLVNLGHRNQNLLNRTLAYITELERTEQDPEVLDRLFRLDHATTRIRRNAESMLVLAGANQTRTWSVPAPAADVVRAALSEIEDYNRIDVYHMQDAAISGGAIADVVHLLAELMENAANFSPPSTQVTVVGQTVPEGYRIRVIDEGIGMTRSELDAANRSIRLATDGRGATKLLGLYVVGRLASRRGIEVTLEASGGRGVTANVVLPRALLADLPAAAPARRDGVDAFATRTPEPSRDVRGAREQDAQEVRDARDAREAAREAMRAAVLEAARPEAARPEAARPEVARPEAPRATAAPANPPGAATVGVVRRVPGAQLPDLGPSVDSGPLLASIDAVEVRGRLSSLQAGVRAGREVEVTESAAEVVEALPTEAESRDVEPEAETPADTPAELPSDVPVELPVEIDLDDLAEIEEIEELEEAVRVVPIRVPGAQLPDLGLFEDGPDAYLAPSAEANRWKLRSFQLDVDAARRTVTEAPDGAGAGRPDRRTQEES